MKIFLSHSTKDAAFVLELAAELKANGTEPWLCEIDIDYGDNFVAKIEEGLKCDLVLLVLSPDAVRSAWTREEWTSALARQVAESRIRLGVLLLRDCEVPELMRTKHRFDARQDPSGAIRDVVAWAARMRDQRRLAKARPRASSWPMSHRTSSDASATWSVCTPRSWSSQAYSCCMASRAAANPRWRSSSPGRPKPPLTPWSSRPAGSVRPTRLQWSWPVA